MKVNVNISAFVSQLARISDTRERVESSRCYGKRNWVAISEYAWLYFIVTSLSRLQNAGTFRWFASRGESHRVGCFVPRLPSSVSGFLNVCASVASWMLRILASAAFPFAARARIHLGRFVRRLYSSYHYDLHSPVPSLVTKLSLRRASGWMRIHKFNSFECVRARYTRI